MARARERRNERRPTWNLPRDGSPGRVAHSRPKTFLNLFNELLFTTKLYMRDLTQIEPEWLPELAPHFFAAHQGLAAGAGHLAGAGGAGGRAVSPRAVADGLPPPGGSGGSKLAQIAREREMRGQQ